MRAGVRVRARARARVEVRLGVRVRVTVTVTVTVVGTNPNPNPNPNPTWGAPVQEASRATGVTASPGTAASHAARGYARAAPAGPGEGWG